MSQTSDLLIDSVKKMQRGGDDYLFQLYRAYHRTKQKFLVWNLYIWFPLLHFISFFNVMKWTKEFPAVQLALLGFGGTIFGIKVSEIKGYETATHFLKSINLEKMDWGWLVIAYLVVWYLVTLITIQKQVTNPDSKYFLYRAYQKWDAGYKVFGSLLESTEREKLFEAIAKQLDESTTIIVDESKLVELFAKYEEKTETLEKELKDKRELVEVLIKMNGNLSEVIVEHEDVHYKHLDMLNLPYIVYQKQRRQLVHVWSDGILQYDKSISLRKSDNFFVKVRDAKGYTVISNQLIGFWAGDEKDGYAVAFKIDENHPLIKEYDILNKEEFQLTVEAILSQVK